MTRSVLRPLAAFGFLGVVALVVGAQAPTATPDRRADGEAGGRLARKASTWPSRPSTTRRPRSGPRCSSRTSTRRSITSCRATSTSSCRRPPPSTRRSTRATSTSPRRSSNRFLKRSDERLKMVAEIAKEKPDFTVDESMADDPDKLDYPANDADARERMRKRVKLELLQSKVDNEPDEEALKKLIERYRDRNLPGPPVQLVRPARILSQQPEPDVRPAHHLHEQGIAGRPHPADLAALPDRDRRLARLRRGLRRRQGADPRRPGRQGRPDPARGQDPRHPEARTAPRSTSSRSASATSSARSAARPTPTSA